MASGGPVPGGPAIVVVTGVQAAGKSTVARLLAQRFARGAHVEADALQRMIVPGAEWARDPGPLGDEVTRQLRLRLRNMCLLGISFYEAGFVVVLDDIILGERWSQLQEDLRGYPYSLVVLAPSLGSLLRRDAGRGKRPLGEEWARYLDGELRATMRGIGHWIDSSDLSAAETVDRAIDHLLSARGQADA